MTINANEESELLLYGERRQTLPSSKSKTYIKDIKVKNLCGVLIQVLSINYCFYKTFWIFVISTHTQIYSERRIGLVSEMIM